MPEEPEFYVECHTAGEAGRALGRGYAAIATAAVAAECGAEPGDAEDLPEALESHLRPYGGAEPPGAGGRPGPR